MTTLAWNDFILLLKDWIVLREKSILVSKRIATIRNETSYLTNEKIDHAIGNLIKPGRITSNADMEFNIACKELTEIHIEMNNILQKIIVTSSQFDYNNDKKNTCPVDKIVVNKVINQLKQTMLLELSIASNLSSVNDDNGYISNGNLLVLDNDVIVTLLACYTYPPYIDLKEIEAIIALLT